MKEIYYKKYSFNNDLDTKMFYDKDKLVELNNVKGVNVEFPNGKIEFVEFIIVDKFINDRDAGYRDMNFIINLNYNGIILTTSARELISKKCKVFIEL